ncbi:MAG: hypothetical protein SOV90_09660 [Lachnospiraceae bacterium]|nr:hypothetical protein [Eubacteriales bacterium]MDY2608169.1 hypothetical protein [Lachnospiraceae bacterium]
MALIKCTECGKEYSGNADSCPNCGNPNPDKKDAKNVIVVEKTKGVWSAGRLTIGIISILLFVFIAFQSCAVGLSKSLEENGESTGSIGLFVAIFILVAGIVGICTRNSKSKVGAIITTVFYWLGAILTIGTGDTYGDLPIWGVISFIFGLVFLIAAIKTKKEK